MQQQELWVIDQGYRWLSVKSKNQFPAMLKLLISSGYKVSGYENLGDLEENKIHFIKELKPAL